MAKKQGGHNAMIRHCLCGAEPVVERKPNTGDAAIKRTWSFADHAFNCPNKDWKKNRKPFPGENNG